MILWRTHRVIIRAHALQSASRLCALQSMHKGTAHMHSFVQAHIFVYLLCAVALCRRRASAIPYERKHYIIQSSINIYLVHELSAR